MDMVRKVALLLISLAIVGVRLEVAKVEDEEDFVPVTQMPLPKEKSARIVGGRNAEDRQFPHQISLRYRNGHICGGSIISNSYILTAAHCVTSTSQNMTKATPARDLSIRAGTNFIYTGGVIIQVGQVIPHPKFRNVVNDIALLKLRTPLTFNQRIKSIPLASTTASPGSEVVTSGWGRLRSDGAPSTSLQYASLNAISNQDCRRQIGNVPNSIICLAHRNGLGACQGDSGGPAVFKGQLVGITNFVIGSCGTSAPDGFANVAYFLPWIIENSRK